MCIGHGIRVAARAFVTFVKGRLKCLLLLFIIIKHLKDKCTKALNLLRVLAHTSLGGRPRHATPSVQISHTIQT